MPERAATQRLTAAVSRLLALIEHHEIVRRFRSDWNVFDHTADSFADQVDRVKETLAEVERNA